MNRFLLSALLVLGGLGPALAQRVVTQTAQLAAGQRVDLSLKFGHLIRVRPGTGAVLTVKATVNINDNQQNDALALRLEQAGDEVRIVEELDQNRLRQTYFRGHCEGSTNNGSYDGAGARGDGRYSYCVRTDYEVTVPPGTELHVSTISGNVDLRDLSGPVSAESISGNLTLHHLTGAVTARSTSGNVVLAQATGTVTARSVSGNVTLTEPGNNPVQASSVSGSVDATWPASQAATLSLKSVSGEVYADPAVTFSNLRPHSNVGYELHGSYGQGGSNGPLVQLHTVSGNVFFRKH